MHRFPAMHAVSIYLNAQSEILIYLPAAYGKWDGRMVMSANHRPKVLVGTVLGACFPPECMNSHLQLDYTPIQYIINRTGIVHGSTEINEKALYHMRVKSITDARNWLLDEAFKHEWDYLLWLDSDVKVKPETLTEMVKFTPREKVITSFAVYRQGTTVLDYCRNGYAAWTGFHCVLVAREVHEKVGHFRADYAGEDVNYCHRIHQAKYKIYLARDVKVDHRFFRYENRGIPTAAAVTKPQSPEAIPAHNGIYAVVFDKSSIILIVSACNKKAHVNDTNASNYVQKKAMPVLKIKSCNYVDWAAKNGLQLTSKPVSTFFIRKLLGNK